jgi:hypothetical protein
MFNFTTTTVLNSLSDLTTGKDLITSLSDKSGVTVKRVGTFLKDNVLSFYKAVGNDPVMEKVTIDLSKVKGAEKGKQYRLALYIGLTQASQDSRYSNDMVLKGKPFTVDFVWKDSSEATVEALVKTIKKYEVLVYGEKLLDIDSDSFTITLTATTEFQRFKKVNIEEFDKDAYMGMGDYTPVLTLEDTEAVKKVDGVEGFGTYSYILHNLRLPTSARTEAFAINQDESPIPGAVYDQYTIHYCKNRGPLGMNAVGEVTKSVTTHVFYVLHSLADKFEEAFGDIKATDAHDGHESKSEAEQAAETVAGE